MQKIVKITEGCYNAFINGEDLNHPKSIIDEALHYPEFLDKIKFEIESKICNCISSMIKTNKEKLEIDLNISNNLYLNKINLDITIDYGKDITDKKLYRGFSNSNEKLSDDNKLDTAYLTFVFPVSNEGNFEPSIISYTVSHEVGHLYDDWNDLVRGGDGIFVKQTNIVNTDFLQKHNSSDNKLIRNIAWICYMSLYTENNSFTGQLMQELKSLNCNYANVYEKFKETTSYRNLKETENDFFEALSKNDDTDLYDVNSYIIKFYPEISAPKLNIGQFDGNKYRNMLSKWAERTLYRMAKRYCGVVQLYCDKLAESYFNKNCILLR